MGAYLLDASAILAFMAQEPGAARVREILLAGEGSLTSVNLSEVASKLVARGMSLEDAEAQCRSLGLMILAVDEELAFAAAGLVPSTRPLGLSLGDRICLAAAMRSNSIALTADKAWGKLPGLIVEVIR